MTHSLTELLKEFRADFESGKYLSTPLEEAITRAYEIGVADERIRILEGGTIDL